MPEAYQRLLLDVMHGDASLFARADEVELAWGIIDPIQAGWEQPGRPPLALYEAGEWGPAERHGLDVPAASRVVRQLPGAALSCLFRTGKAIISRNFYLSTIRN